jgi:hypothetical protein
LTNESKQSDLNEYVALAFTLQFMKNFQTNNKSTDPNSHAQNHKDTSKVIKKLSNPYLKALFSYQLDRENFDQHLVIYFVFYE